MTRPRRQSGVTTLPLHQAHLIKAIYTAFASQQALAATTAVLTSTIQQVSAIAGASCNFLDGSCEASLEHRLSLHCAIQQLHSGLRLRSEPQWVLQRQALA